MSTSVGIAFHLNLNPGTPNAVLRLMDVLFNRRKPIDEIEAALRALNIEDTDFVADEFADHIVGTMSEFETWRWSYYKPDVYKVESRAAVPVAMMGQISLFLNALRPYLVLSDGAILARVIPMDESTETVFWYEWMNDEINVDKGYEYPEGFLDPSHPANAHLGCATIPDAPAEFIPILNYRVYTDEILTELD